MSDGAVLHTLGGGPRVVVSTAAFHARVRGSVPGLGGLKETKLFLPHPRVKVSIVGSLRDREVACSASDRQGSNFESCVWRTVSSQSSHHPQEVLLAQFSLYVHKGGLKPDSFHFFILFSTLHSDGAVLHTSLINNLTAMLFNWNIHSPTVKGLIDIIVTACVGPWYSGKLPAWKVGDRGFETRGFETRSGIQQIFPSPLTRKNSIFWEASVTEK